MRKLLFFTLLFLQFNSIAQTSTSLECVNREFNVQIHIITDSFYWPRILNSQAISNIDSINKVWAPICMKFNICKIRLDSNFNFWNWHQDTMEAEYLAINHEPRTINIIVVNKLLMPAGKNGYSNGLISSRGQPYIVVVGSNLETWIHELGHYFGLLHTFNATSSGSNVLADNSNCITTGDFLCDTPPDPNGGEQNCINITPIIDANGMKYNPLIENFMSYYTGCRRSFTHNQYEKMIKTYKLDTEAHF